MNARFILLSSCVLAALRAYCAEPGKQAAAPQNGPGLVIESLDGPVTRNEVVTFKETGRRVTSRRNVKLSANTQPQ